ncbi:hypothetical protein PV325_009421 [Microctonus aethiopoides]|nr:hypothetical protein PV325_009421 [Microctonus aethiopoides]
MVHEKDDDDEEQTKKKKSIRVRKLQYPVALRFAIFCLGQLETTNAAFRILPVTYTNSLGTTILNSPHTLVGPQAKLKEGIWLREEKGIGMRMRTAICHGEYQREETMQR